MSPNTNYTENSANTQEQGAALKGFRDVPESRWSHSVIMKTVGLGMFAGTSTPDANGMGTFDPEGTMTRAQFLTVVTKHLFGDELAAMPAGEYWYTNYYQVALTAALSI